jgi:hypothetical protein
MNTSMLKRARKHFTNDMAPRHVQRHNILSWVRSVRFLGPKWLIAAPTERK